jgi:hypothetical protein
MSAVDDICEILDSLLDLSETLEAAEPELRHRVFYAFRLSVSLDRNARQIHVALGVYTWSSVSDTWSSVSDT